MNSIGAYKVLGLASGSSLDGVNASIITTDGIDIFSFGRTFEIPYDENIRESLRHMQKNFVTMNDDEKLRIENALTEFHLAAAREIMFDVEGINLIGFGGHVICHKPKEHILYQIGDGQKMADALQVKVVSKFRDADILAGGQGAPLAAIYHGALAQKMEKPIVFVDIGGISSLTWIGQNGEMIAFDAGPGNAAINWWVNKHGGMHMDYNGKLAIQGHVNEKIVNALMRHKFFAQYPPKSIDRDIFKDKLENLEGLSLEDGAATATAFTAEAIAYSLAMYVPQLPEKLIVCGGGANNPTLMRFIRQRLHNVEVVSASELGWNTDAVEAQGFAYMAVRRLNNMPISFPGTTGVPVPMAGGEIHKPESSGDRR